MKHLTSLLAFAGCLCSVGHVTGQVHPCAAPGITSLTNSSVRFQEPNAHFVTLERGGVKIVVVDNAAMDRPDLPGHREGYNGVASLTRTGHPKNLFVPSVAGLNFEHIHDGTLAGLPEKFEPRKSPMSLRVIDQSTVEVYQPPTVNWRLESCGRYHLLADGTIEYTFECIPRAAGYRHGYIGLFWASYVEQPEAGTIWFQGHVRSEPGPDKWIEATSPAHGTDSTHGPADPAQLPPVDADFPLTLVHHPSKYVYGEPWYFGVSHGMAYVQMFRKQDQIWLAQSPSGGGNGNPAWDFQWFVPDFVVGSAYGFVMRAAYLPFESAEQIARDTLAHRQALNP